MRSDTYGVHRQFLGRSTPRTCVLCVDSHVDSQAAFGALIQGSTTSELGALLANLFWNVEARCATRWWVEYVNTKSNIAEKPSRECGLLTGASCAGTFGLVPSRSDSALGEASIGRIPCLTMEPLTKRLSVPIEIFCFLLVF